LKIIEILIINIVINIHIMETTYKWCDGCYENQPNQLSHTCLTDYVNINATHNAMHIYIKIGDLFLTGNYYNIDNLNKNITIRLYEGTKIFGKIVINYVNDKNIKYDYFHYKGDQIIMERIIDYFLNLNKFIKNI
jgi:hypothetical protein